MLVKASTAIDGLSGQGRRGGRRFGRLRRAAGRDPIDMHRLRNVFDLLLAEIGKGDGQLGTDLVAYRARNANPAGLGERFEPGRDVNTVAKQILALDEDIANMRADAEAHWLTHCSGGVFFDDGSLNRDRTLDGVDRIGEVGDDTVPGAAEDALAMGGDQLVEDDATGGEPAQGADLVPPHQPAVACDIGRKDRRELADRLFFLAHDSDEADSFAVCCAKEALFSAAVADRAACPLIRVLKVDSETIRPFHTAAGRSSLLTTRSRWPIEYSRRSKT
jgi:hypothetical protein